MQDKKKLDWLNPAAVRQSLARAQKKDPAALRAMIEKAGEAKGLTMDEVAALTMLDDPDLLQEMQDAARRIKDRIYGDRIVLFAPLYVSNLCANECLYCAFRQSNKNLTRRALDTDAIMRETRHLVDQGHKRVLLVAGESYPKGVGIDYILQAIDAVYATKGSLPGAEIRRINANLAPLSVGDFERLKQAGIGTYQLFQETYDRDVYRAVHPSGKKADFAWRASAMDRAMQAGIDDVGMGVLLGLADWRFDLLSLIQHIDHLEKTFGVGSHTISVPRLEPAHGSDMAATPPALVSDADFKKIVTILRLAVPYTGIIMSTRESADMRRETYALGVSQISAGSRTNPGGYADGEQFDQSQFQLGDHRAMREIVDELVSMGYVPSFCTACYRVGRTGDHFMEWAKTGKIHEKCGPNALATLQEYLIDYAPPHVRIAGENRIAAALDAQPARTRATSERLLRGVRAGKRDLFC